MSYRVLTKILEMSTKILHVNVLQRSPRGSAEVLQRSYIILQRFYGGPREKSYIHFLGNFQKGLQ